MDEPRTAIRMEAKANAKDSEVGMEAIYRLALPKGRCYQLQGSAFVDEGKSEGAYTAVFIRAKSDKGTYEDRKSYKGTPFYCENFDDQWNAYVVDLTEFAGEEIELVLSLKAEPKYSHVGDQEILTPERISAVWPEMKIIDSSFRVVLGASEEVPSSAKTFSRKPVMRPSGWDDVYLSSSLEQSVVLGQPTRDWDLNNPGESGENTVKIPGASPWFAGYFTSQLYEVPEAYYAYPCMFDFSSNPSYNLYNTSTTNINNSVYRSNNIAINVISPGPQYDDVWPNHVAIASATMGKLDGSTDVVHAFIQAEDAWRETTNGPRYWGVYDFINYTRSSGANLGKSFTKTSWGSTDNYPIITYEMTEDDLYHGMIEKMYGCGEPSIIQKDGFYYIIYHTIARSPKPNWESFTGINRFYVYNDNNGDGILQDDGDVGVSAKDPNTGLYTDEYWGVWTSITIARASVSAVNDSDYDKNDNPWHKYYERASLGQEWTQEPGIGGKASMLINANLDSQGRRSEFANSSDWRAYPKVSYNSWAAGYSDVGNYMLICTGQTTSYTECVLIHNSDGDDLTEWSDEVLVVFVTDTSLGGTRYNYPTLIGDQGQSTLTTESNQLYYQKK